jgi:hypothetical protein
MFNYAELLTPKVEEPAAAAPAPGAAPAQR